MRSKQQTTTREKEPLSITHPELAAEWHPTKNGDMRPEDVVAGSNKKVWWKCPKAVDHEWEAKIGSRAAGNGCPCCRNLKVVPSNSLATTHPDLAQQWHPTKNSTLTPNDGTYGNGKPVWWLCEHGHEWRVSCNMRTSKGKGRGCPYCSNQKVDRNNCLASTHPEIACQWHPTKNGELTPHRVTAGSGKQVWWKCPKASDHEWQAHPCERIRGFGCPFCAGRKVTNSNCLATTHEDLAKEWHPTKNEDSTPTEVTAGSHRSVWWRCSEGHEWEAQVCNRASGTGCPYCLGRYADEANNLAATHPLLAAEWHPTKNGDLTPDDIVAGSNNAVWWRCASGHEWSAMVNARRSGGGCPFCSNKRVDGSNCLEATLPELTGEWHPTKNKDLTPRDVPAGSSRKVWWKCPKGDDHEWQATIASRAAGCGCPCCSGRKAVQTNCLSTTHPQIAVEWHPTKNGSVTPNDVVSGSSKRIWWKCSLVGDHEWFAKISHRANGSGCPYCNQGWTLENIRLFVSSLGEHLEAFTPAELYLIFQHNHLFQTEGRSKTFIKALATGRFPKEEIDKFVNSEPSLVDQFVQDPAQTLEALETNETKPTEAEDAAVSQANAVVEQVNEEGEPQLPVVETKDVLASLGLQVASSADEEAVEFLIASGIAKIWKHAYRDEASAVAQAEAFHGEGYGEEIRRRFLDEYRQVKDLAIPEGYAFRINGKLTPPNLMQRHFAVRVQQRKRVGNWSGTGAGKTLAAVLATRAVGSKLTVICCPNSVVEGWRRAIRDIFPDSMIATKTFAPGWAPPSPRPSPPEWRGSAEGHRYLILNYEAFQQPDSAERVRSLAAGEPIDFVIVDEIHYAKQRSEDISQRRQLVAALTTLAADGNPDLHVLGMSATPVINNLQEGKSMVELVTGLAHDELDTRPTVPNCMALHQRLVTLGIRWMPEYQLRYEQREIELDCGPFLDEIRALGGKGTPLALEQILTRARLPQIRAHVEPKTLIYTHYVQGIDRLLRDALVEDGWKVGFYTGDDKSGLDGFLEGDVDVLIGSSAIGTGVDGLQQVCNRLIVNVLPWTAAEFEQLKGRIYRQGQSREDVSMILPLTFAEVHGERWSWCQSKMQRLRFKKSIADAAVDGVVPEGHLRTPAQAYQDVMAWLERLDSGKVEVITRPRILVPLPDTDAADVKRRRRRYGDFSAMNRTWNQTRSEATHERLQSNPEEWAQYHTLYRETRKDWAVVPYEEMIRWCRQRSGYVIGDFGCGEAKLAEAVSDRHTIHSFDHVAINENVVACDLAHVPLDDDTLDVAIFSLSLMGANFADYLREGYRTLKLDGQLHILEATERFTDRNAFVKKLEGLGFALVSVEDNWKFTHIRALKTERRPREDIELRF